MPLLEYQGAVGGIDGEGQLGLEPACRRGTVLWWYGRVRLNARQNQMCHHLARARTEGSPCPAQHHGPWWALAYRTQIEMMIVNRLPKYLEPRTTSQDINRYDSRARKRSGRGDGEGRKDQHEKTVHEIVLFQNTSKSISLSWSASTERKCL